MKRKLGTTVHHSGSCSVAAVLAEAGGLYIAHSTHFGAASLCCGFVSFLRCTLAPTGLLPMSRYLLHLYSTYHHRQNRFCRYGGLRRTCLCNIYLFQSGPHFFGSTVGVIAVLLSLLPGLALWEQVVGWVFESLGIFWQLSDNHTSANCE